MTTKSKLKSPVMGRVAMTLLLIVCALLPCTADFVHTIDLSSETNEFHFVAGTVTKGDNGRLYVTANAGYNKGRVKKYKIVDDVVVSEDVYEQGVVINNVQVDYYDCSGDWQYADVTFIHTDKIVNVTFDMNGHGGENINQNDSIKNKMARPSDPTEEGLVFGGWFMDADGTIPFDFNTKLNTIEYSSYSNSDTPKHYNLTLYAKWLVKVEGGSCGTGVTWSGYKNARDNEADGDITISGNGEIAEYAFQGKVKLRRVVINDGVTSIGESAFQDCTGLTSVTIPNSVTSIDRDAFLGTGLTSVTIPASVTSIGEGAFYNCTGLTSVTIGNSVTSIGESAFYNCTGLTSVTIPASVTSIGKDAFSNCSHLTSVTIYASSLETYGSGAFYQSTPTPNIYVFENSVDTYKAGWKGDTFENYIQAIPAANLAVTTPVNENPQNTGEFWSTYYHPAANVKINTNGVEIYKATLNEQKTSVTLTKVDGNVIKAGQAVMLKATGSGALSMELTPEVPTGDYSGNDLKGGNTVQAGYDAYTLAAENEQFGFYKFNGTLNASKAHLEIPQGSTSGVREFIGFDGDATRIVNNEQRIVNSEWYTLDGRRLSGKPTAKGIYVVDGRKLVIK